jgi:hypothetical protein
MEGGYEMLRTIVTTLNTIWRRTGGVVELRDGDIGALMTYWATSNEAHRNGEMLDWRSVMGRHTGMVLASHPHLQWNVAGMKIRKRRRYPAAVGPVMRRRAARNLELAGRVARLGEYAEEYALDVLESSVINSYDVEEGKVGENVRIAKPNRDEEFAAERVIVSQQSGRGGWRDEDSFCKQVAVGYLFAGSERTARAYLKDGGRVAVSAGGTFQKKICRGLNLLAGRTSEDKPLNQGFFVCSEKYWSHIETVLRQTRNGVLRQTELGFAVAQRAIAMGALI